VSDDIALPDGRTMPADEYHRRLELLKAPFPADELEKLPKQIKRNDDDRGRCEDTPRGRQYSADGYFCGGWHAYSLHLDYVGHAGITDRLNEVDPLWSWEPFALTDHGTPLFCDGGMWGKLTVLGMTRIGFGDAGNKTGPNAVKEIIGDFIRNAAMRFGVGTYLWSKSDAALAKKRAEEGDDARTPGPPVAPANDQPAPPPEPWDEKRATAAIHFARRTQNPEATLRSAWDAASQAGSDQKILDMIEAAAQPATYQQVPPTGATPPHESEIVN
jgi:hypothetical protein